MERWWRAWSTWWLPRPRSCHSKPSKRTAFSNYGGDLATIAAPGEGLVPTYPAKHSAQVSGTSFSAALVSGGAALLIGAVNSDTRISLEQGDARRAFSRAAECKECDLGSGIIDLSEAVQYIRQEKLPDTK